MRGFLLCLGLALGACHHDDPPPADKGFAGALPAAEDLSALAEQTAAMQGRLREYLDAGFVITRRGEEVLDRGDAALWTGLAVAALDCDQGRPLFDALAADIVDHGGRIHRHPALDEEDTSRDMLIGAMFGLVQRWNHCPDDQPRIREVWAAHVAYVEGLGDGRLYPGAGPGKQINGGLFWLWDKVSLYFGVRAAEPRVGKGKFEGDLIGTATGIVALKQACYPLNLNMLEQYISVAVGSPVGSGTRAAWCGVTRGTGIPMLEWYCERESAVQYLATYTTDWTYRHQRCKWEDEDHDKQGPGVDYLLMQALASRTIL